MVSGRQGQNRVGSARPRLRKGSGTYPMNTIGPEHPTLTLRTGPCETSQTGGCTCTACGSPAHRTPAWKPKKRHREPCSNAACSGMRTGSISPITHSSEGAQCSTAGGQPDDQGAVLYRVRRPCTIVHSSEGARCSTAGGNPDRPRSSAQQGTPGMRGLNTLSGRPSDVDTIFNNALIAEAERSGSGAHCSTASPFSYP